MSNRAEEKALEAYPVDWDYGHNEGVNGFDWNEDKRNIYLSGYEQAEKDLALTWEDMVEIRRIMFNINKRISTFGLKIPSDEEYGKEVLNRFLESKKEG